MSNDRPRTKADSAWSAAVLGAGAGFCAQGAQVVMLREMLATCRGAEWFLGVVLAAGMLWSAVGCALARALPARSGARLEARAPHSFLTAALVLATGCLLPVQVCLARAFPLTATGIPLPAAAVAAFLVTAPAALAGGAAFVSALASAPADCFAAVYGGEAAGAVLGAGLLAVTSSDPVALGPAMAAAAGTGLLAAGCRPAWLWKGVLASAALSASLAAADANLALHAWRWRRLQPDAALVGCRDSRQGQIAVLRHERQPQYTVYYDTTLNATVPTVGQDDPDVLLRALFLLGQNPAARRILLMGDGLGSLPGTLVALGVSRVEVVESDLELFAAVAALPGVARPPNGVTAHATDGRRFVNRSARAGEHFDLIAISVPLPLSAALNRLFTVEFYRNCAAALTPEGVLVTQVLAAANYAESNVLTLSASVLRTLQSAFPEVLVAPGSSHTFVAARRPGQGSLDPALLGRRLAARGVWHAGFDPQYRSAAGEYLSALLANLIVSNQVDSLRGRLEAMRVPVNTDTRPVVYARASTLWAELSCGSARSAWWAQVVLLVGPVLLLLVLGACWFLSVGRPQGGSAWRRRELALAAAAGATGFFAMAGELILLLRFQCVAGDLYGLVAAFVAVFMGGLGVGAHVGGRASHGRRVLLLASAGIGACGLLLPVGFDLLTAALPPLPVSAGLSLSVAFVVGGLDGMVFPVLERAWRESGAALAGAWVYGADLLGATAGALLTGAWLLPWLGTHAALGLSAGLTVACLLAVTCTARENAPPRGKPAPLTAAGAGQGPETPGASTTPADG